jgi:hypothetical protein
MPFVSDGVWAHGSLNRTKPMEIAMLVAIESFVRLFERLILEPPIRASQSNRRADNDNDETSEEDRRWAAYR